MMLFIKTGFITGPFVKYAQIFETGIFLWATLVGAISMLILYTLIEYNLYVKTHLGNTLQFITFTTLTGIYYLGIIFIGNMMNIV